MSNVSLEMGNSFRNGMKERKISPILQKNKKTKTELSSVSFCIKMQILEANHKSQFYPYQLIVKNFYLLPSFSLLDTLIEAINPNFILTKNGFHFFPFTLIALYIYRICLHFTYFALPNIFNGLVYAIS